MPKGATYHWQLRKTQRSAGQSAVAGAAYQSCTRLIDARTGVVHDYRRKRGLRHSEIILPAGAPPELLDRQTLWDAAEAAEKHPRAVVARSIIAALPCSLSADDRLAALREHAQWLADTYGVAVDLAAHDPHGGQRCKDDQVHGQVEAPGGDARNFHGHLRITTRIVTGAGLGAKTRILDERGTGPAEIERMRAAWAATLNHRLETAALVVRVDHRSKQRVAAGRGEAPEPVAPHLTVAEVGSERRGKRTRVGDKWRKAKADQRQHRLVRDQLRAIRAERCAAERNARALRLAEDEAETLFVPTRPDHVGPCGRRLPSQPLPQEAKPVQDFASLTAPAPLFLSMMRPRDGANGRTVPRSVAQRQWRKDLSAYLGALATTGSSADKDVVANALDAFMASSRAMYTLTGAAAERVMYRVRRTIAVAAPHMSRLHAQAERAFEIGESAGKRFARTFASRARDAR